MKIGILGSGTWGTALANALIVKHSITLYTRFQKEYDYLVNNRVHPNLKGAILSDEIKFSLSLEEVIKDKDIIIFAVPSPYVRETAIKAKPYLKKNK